MSTPPDSVILVGGRGQRLQSVVRDLPKPLASVGSRPFVERVIEQLKVQGIRRVVFCTGHLSEVVESSVRDGSQYGLEILCGRDPIPLGTAGAIQHALAFLHTNPILVLNGDSFCPWNLVKLQEVHRRTHALGTLWLTSVVDRRQFGTVELDATGAVLQFREKSDGPGGGLINAGVYLLQRGVLEQDMPIGPSSLERDLFPVLAAKRQLYAVVGEGPFLDIGTPASYAQAEGFFADFRKR